MIALSGTSPARESCDQTKTWTIFVMHSQDENGLVWFVVPKSAPGMIHSMPDFGTTTLEHDRAERNVPGA
jgi:hypothetical protein